jgi:hypothetical protein
MRDHNVQTIRSAALEDGYQNLLAGSLLVAGEGRTLEPERRAAHASHRDGGITEEKSA